MIITKRKPVSVGEIITEEYLTPLDISKNQVATAMNISQKKFNDICTGKKRITADIALMLAKVFNNSPEFWLNIQRRIDIWTALNTPEIKLQIDKAIPIRTLKKEQLACNY